MKDKLIIFCGAGTSRSLGLPTWVDLVKNVIEKLSSQKPELKILIEGMNMGLLTPIEVLNKVYGFKEEVYKYIAENFILSDESKVSFQKEVLEVSKRIITTNFDNAFELANNSLHTAQYYSTFPIALLKEKNDFVFKLHGSANADPSHCIIFEKDYEQLYKNDEKAAIFKLKDLFHNYTFLFLGFSFQDAYVKDIFNSINKLFEGYGGKHYAIVADPKEIDDYPFLEKINIESYNNLQLYISKLKEFKGNDGSIVTSVSSLDKQLLKRTSIYFLLPEPIDKKLDIERHKVLNSFNEFECEVVIGNLSLNTLRQIDEGDVLILMTKVLKEKIYIEDEYLSSQLVEPTVLLDNISKAVKNLVLIVDEPISRLKDDKIIVLEAHKKDVFDRLLFKLFKNREKTINHPSIYIPDNFNVNSLPILKKGSVTRKYLFSPKDLLEILSPKTLQSFVGRINDQLNIVKKVLEASDNQTILNIKGSGGIGKTTLISKISIELVKRGYFTRGIKFSSCEFIKDYNSFETLLARGFFLDNVENLKEHLLENPFRHDLLIILDNFETITTLDDKDVIKKIFNLVEFASDFATIVVTSREQIGLSYEVVYELTSMTTDEAYELFVRSYRSIEKKDDKAILRADILENLLNNNPLAIKLVTKNLPNHKNINELKIELESKFFETTSIDYSSIFDKTSDLNIERTKSLYQSINYSYNKLSTLEKLAFELLHLFPNGIEISNFKKCFKKSKAETLINDLILKSLENKSLVENLQGRLKLQPIISRFAEYQFNGRSSKEKLKYYEDAFVYNNFYLQIARELEIKGTYSQALRIVDGFKTNLLKVLDYLDQLVNSKTIEKIYLIDYIYYMNLFINGDGEVDVYLKQLQRYIPVFEDLDNATMFFKIMSIRKRYQYKTFDAPYQELCTLLPLEYIKDFSLDEEQKIKSRYVQAAFGIYSYEGHTYELLRFALKNSIHNWPLFNEVFYLGLYNLGMYEKESFYTFEMHSNLNRLEVEELEKYISTLHDSENLEILQCTYTIAKNKSIPFSRIRSLVVTNPYTSGLKSLMFAFNEKIKEKKDSYFKKAIQNLSHIKYYHIEAIYFYCKFLQEENSSEFQSYYNLGVMLANKFKYAFLSYKFSNLKLEDKELDYIPPDTIFQEWDIESYIKSYNKFKMELYNVNA